MPDLTPARLQNILSKQPQWLLALYAGITAFCTYSCMYAFRKPFTAGSYTDVSSGAIQFKVWLVTAQVLGYMISKFYGIRFISEMKPAKRAGFIVLFIAVAWVALLLFAIAPVPLKPLCMFLNGLPLGMVWGLVFGFLEGRRLTEMMGAVLASSFIFASGFVKTTGKWLMNDLQVTEFWMPFATGSLFIIPMLLFVLLLNGMPAPNLQDLAARTERKPMDAASRKHFLQQFGIGLVLVVMGYILITIVRDLRDNFMNEMLQEMHLGNNASLFTKIETPVSVIVLILTALLIVVKQNFKAFMLNHIIIIFGLLLSLTATLGFSHHLLTPMIWMVATGTGLYLSYVPFNCIYFERMIASYKITGNVGFVMYIADSFGYLGSLLVLFLKEFSGLHLSWVNFIVQTIILCSATGILLVGAGLFFFSRKYAANRITYSIQPAL